QIDANTMGVVRLALGTTVASGRVRMAASEETQAVLVAEQLAVAEGATLELGGTIHSHVVNRGRLQLASSPQQVTIDGNYVQTDTGRLDVAIQGTEPGTQYDQLIVTGIATLDGLLNVNRASAFVPDSV